MSRPQPRQRSGWRCRVSFTRSGGTSGRECPGWPGCPPGRRPEGGRRAFLTDGGSDDGGFEEFVELVASLACNAAYASRDCASWSRMFVIQLWMGRPRRRHFRGDAGHPAGRAIEFPTTDRNVPDPCQRHQSPPSAFFLASPSRNPPRTAITSSRPLNGYGLLTTQIDRPMRRVEVRFARQLASVVAQGSALPLLVPFRASQGQSEGGYRRALLDFQSSGCWHGPATTGFSSK